MRSPLPYVGLGLSFAMAALSASAAQPPPYVVAAVKNVDRPAVDTARDGERKPEQTVAFAGIRPGDKVLELEPGGGYYTRILSNVVGSKGRVYSLTFLSPPPPAPGRPRMNPIDDVYRLSQAPQFPNITPMLGGGMGRSGRIGLPQQVDVVWTSDNYHDFHNKFWGPLEVAKINESIFRDLKPGGVYIVIDHATAPGQGLTQTQTLHRIDPATVKAEVLAAGFVLDGQSQVLANPADDHTRSALTLRDRTDDFVLRFRKPAASHSQEQAAESAGHAADSQMRAYFGNTLLVQLPGGRSFSIFFHRNHTYEQAEHGQLGYGKWYMATDGDLCMRKLTEPYATEGTVDCHPIEFPASTHPRLGSSFTGGPGGQMRFSLLRGYVQP